MSHKILVNFAIKVYNIIMEILIIAIVLVIIVLLCACLAIANFAGEDFSEKYRELSRLRIENDITVVQFFKMINEKFFNNRLLVTETREGTDAYAKGVLFLSRSTINSNNIASFATIAHELGHAKQDLESNKLKKMASLRKLGMIIGFFFFPLLIAGLILIIFGGNLFYYGIGLLAAGLLIFVLAIVIKALTIKIEKEASRNALEFLEGICSESEIKTCKDFLGDAVLTYWADMFRSLLGWTMLTRKGKLFR